MNGLASSEMPSNEVIVLSKNETSAYVWYIDVFSDLTHTISINIYLSRLEFWACTDVADTVHIHDTAHCVLTGCFSSPVIVCRAMPHVDINYECMIQVKLLLQLDQWALCRRHKTLSTSWHWREEKKMKGIEVGVMGVKVAAFPMTSNTHQHRRMHRWDTSL